VVAGAQLSLWLATCGRRAIRTECSPQDGGHWEASSAGSRGRLHLGAASYKVQRARVCALQPAGAPAECTARPALCALYFPLCTLDAAHCTLHIARPHSPPARIFTPRRRTSGPGAKVASVPAARQTWLEARGAQHRPGGTSLAHSGRHSGQLSAGSPSPQHPARPDAEPPLHRWGPIWATKRPPAKATGA